MPKRPPAQAEGAECDEPRAARRRGDPLADAAGAPQEGRPDRAALLASEVVRREREAPAVCVDVAVAAALKGDERLRWLLRALDAAEGGEARASDVYDVVSHRRFGAGVSPSLAERMMAELRKRSSLFSEKQRQSLQDGLFALALTAAAAAAPASDEPASASSQASEIMKRCIDFVRQNEATIEDWHQQHSRTFQVELHRSSLQELWGFTWSREAFDSRRRVLEAVCRPSAAWNWLAQRQADPDGGEIFRVGDELVAVNGERSWEAMCGIRSLLSATLTFVHAPPQRPEPAAPSPPRAEGAGPAPEPPPFTGGGYATDAGSGFLAHAGGQWLFSEAEGVYFHVATGALFVETAPGSGSFTRLDASQAAPGEGEQAAEAVAQSGRRLRGRVRWYGRAKGFGFVAPWPEEGATAAGSGDPAADLFFHRSEVLAGAEGPEAVPPAPLQPGTPVAFELGAQQGGKPCARRVQVEPDLSALCGAAFGAGAAGCFIEQIGVDAKGHDGRSGTGAFTGVVASRRANAGGAEFVAKHLPRELAAALRGREQGGERGARLALQAALRQTQHAFLQYAQRLSENSASLWLSAETLACAALVLGPDAEGWPLLLVSCVGGGRVLVVRRDGSCERVGEPPARGRGDAGGAAPRAAQDSLKVFERGLKGPEISFPVIPGYAGRSRTAEPKGFGAHAWTEKDGSAGGLGFSLHAHRLSWEEDACLVVGSDGAWAALPEDAGVAASVLGALAADPCGAERPEQLAARRLLEAARGGAGGMPADAALVVQRLSWCCLARGGAPAAPPPRAEAAAAEPAAASTAAAEAAPAAAEAPAGAPAAPRAVEAEADMFAGPAAAEAEDDMFAGPAAAEAEDDMFASPAPRAAESEDDVLSGSAGAAGGSAGPPRPSRSAGHWQALARTLERVAAGQAQAPAARGGGSDADDAFAEFCREVGGIS